MLLEYQSCTILAGEKFPSTSSQVGAVRTQNDPILTLKADDDPRISFQFHFFYRDRRRSSSPVKDRRGPFGVRTAPRELFACQYYN